MSIHLPDLDGTLVAFTACASFDLGDGSRFSWLGADHLYVQAKYAARGKPALVQLQFDKWESNTGHFHVECCLADSDFEPGRPELEVETVTEEKVVEYLARMLGQKLDVCLFGHFAAPLDKLPRRGIIQTLLGVSTETCGAFMHLVGAEMCISSDVFARLRWKVDENDTARGSIRADTETVVASDYLDKLSELLLEGIDCFVFENTRDTSEHADTTGTLRTPKGAESA